jgi:hypothetical protein
MLITESSWTLPTLHRAEGSFLVSAYGSLTESGHISSSSTPTMNGRSRHRQRLRQGHLVKWTNAQPDEMGQFPAAAWLARLGYVQEGKPVVVEQRSLEDLWTQRLPLRSQKKRASIPNRDTGSMSPRSNCENLRRPTGLLCWPGAHRLRRRPDEKLCSPKAEHSHRP